MDEKPVLVKKFDSQPKKKFNLGIILIVFLIVAAGIGSGYLLSAKIGGKAGNVQKSGDVSNTDIKKGLIVGMTDEKTFKDSAQGKLEKGGIDGEGSHHLVRGLDVSQTVYLTSSVVDLDKYSGRTVKVWGETFSAQKAGWLMDVGKLEVLE